MDLSHKQNIAETIFEHVHEGIIMLDRNYKILALNKAMEQWTDKPLAELIEKDCIEVFHDSAGICPHCAASTTFEKGEMTVDLQKENQRDATKYAELSAYPIKDDIGSITGCIVFMQDVTERMLSQYEITETKEYLEGFIDNSADAIVTSDLDGMITSWNKGAERIYGFAKEDALGKFFPSVPEFLMEPEREMIEKMQQGEVLRDIETFRKKKDGSIITVSLTLSPIKNAKGEVIGISCISRDISDKKRVEKELVRRNQELSRLFFISSAMRGTLELDRLLRMVLTAVTMSDGLGFNRAILFLLDEKENVLQGAMGVGPSSPVEAGEIWGRLSIEKKSLSDMIREVEAGPLRKDSFFDKLSRGMRIPLHEETILTKTAKEKKFFNIDDINQEPLSDIVLTQQLGTEAYAVVPLISRDTVEGVLWVDNYYNKKPISDEDMRFLAAFANQVATAIESARLYEQIIMAEKELANIFDSIPDMVFLISSDYVVKNINKAVCKRLQKRPEEIIGEKCYKIFHGTSSPWEECPHHRTIESKKEHVGEVEEHYLGGTFISSSSPIFNMKNELIGTVHVLRDITELKRLQERLVMTERMAALGEVAAKVAHEIRNPLISVGGFAKRLEKKLNGNLKEYADIITKEVGRLEGILNEILGFVKEIRIVKESVASESLIDDIISLIQSDIKERGISIVRESDGPIVLYVDPGRMKEALLNLLKNAVQAIGHNGTISIKTCLHDTEAVIEITDTGEGITDENMPFIFDPFFTTKQVGTGLGLSITHRIIEEHKGRIEVKSSPGIGTTFRLFIPVNTINETVK
jgi:PAS domain S-box-containing protein